MKRCSNCSRTSYLKDESGWRRVRVGPDGYMLWVCGYCPEKVDLEVIREKEEYIICAAIHYKTGDTNYHQPKNIESGVVICGRRHHNCIMTKHLMNIPKDIRYVQGFLTNTDRFVDREEAAIIAAEAGQLPHDYSGDQLYSEDLY